ncbi:YchJ family protein [Barrientosiimonas humi]
MRAARGRAGGYVVDVSDPVPDPCPCGSGKTFAECCGPLLSTERLAETAEELMRSRYTAYVYGNREHLWRTWHPKTRPVDVVIDPSVRWISLQINDVRDGGADDGAGVVEFTATHDSGTMHERSRFERRAGRWFYLDDQGD